MSDRFDLDRFVRAQAAVMTDVLAELRSGRKRTHWMWFVFPQLRGLGVSATSRFYGIESLDEARAYRAHALLGPRLMDCTALVNRIEHSSARAIFGSPDDLKLRSCMTLFDRASPDPAFQEALDRYFGGGQDQATLRLLDDVRRQRRTTNSDAAVAQPLRKGFS